MPNLLQRLVKTFSAADRGVADLTPGVHLAAFGKHPAWADHIPDDLGLDHPRLIEVKQVLYVQGIGGNVDGGTWDKLDPAHRIPFGHLFLWRTGSGGNGDGEIVAGRLWHSKDGKGRDRYPMVACARFGGRSLAWALAEVFPLLDQLERDCTATTSEARVRSIVEAARQQLRSRADAPAPPDAPASEDPTAYLSAHADFCPDRTGLLRVLYLIEHDMAGFREEPGGAFRSGIHRRLESLRPEQMRVPACDAAPGSAAVRWSRFLSDRLGPAAPIFAAVPLTGGWVDMIVGKPAAPQFYCLRTSPAALPLSTEIPYSMSPDFIARTESALTPPSAAVE